MYIFYKNLFIMGNAIVKDYWMKITSENRL